MQDYRKEVTMTSDQVQYWKNVEQARANRASENLRRLELEEIKRTNLAQEMERSKLRLANYAVGMRNAAATERQNFINYERQKQEALQNLRSYQANLTSLAETERANKAREAETTRTNMANEWIKQGELGVKHRSQFEIERSNRAQEAISKRGQNFQLAGNLAKVTGDLIPKTIRRSGGINYAK